jgi:hypothetical protein
MRLGRLIAAACLLAACGSSKATAPSTTAATAPIARADRYLELVEPVNCAIGEAHNVVDVDDMPTVARKIADTERAFAEGLRSERWEPDVQPSVDKLAALVAKQADGWDAAATSDSSGDWLRHLAAIDLSAGAAASADVRAHLGLAEANPDTPCPGHGG